MWAFFGYAFLSYFISDASLRPLPYKTQRLLWQLKLESLEQEVLLLVGAVNSCSFLAKRHVSQLIKSRHLVSVFPQCSMKHDIR